MSFNPSFFTISDCHSLELLLLKVGKKRNFTVKFSLVCSVSLIRLFMKMFVINFSAILCKYFFCRWLMVIGIAFEGFALVWYLFLLANAKPCKLFYLILSTFKFLLVPSLLFSAFQIMLLQESIEYSSFCQSTPFCSLCEKEKRATEAAAKVENFTTGVRRLSFRPLCDSLSVLKI